MTVCSQYFRIPPRVVVLYRDLITFWHLYKDENGESSDLLQLVKLHFAFESDIESDAAFSWCFYSRFSCVHLLVQNPTLTCSPPARKITLLKPGSSC